jgi:hypothetical protein
MPMKRQWMAKVVALAVVVMVGAAVAAMDPVGAPAAPRAGEPALVAPNAAAAQCQAEILPAGELAPDANAPEPVVVCLLIPECWSNSDCDAKCGAKLGRCVHNDCPARICRCR